MIGHNLLGRKEYGFLKTNPDLENVIYLVVSGSHAYGTHNENSDIDLRGVTIERSNHIYGLDIFEQFEDRDSDTVIYGLKKFANLLAKANPNTIELLGVENDCIAYISDSGHRLRENAELFLSKRVAGSFGNYALAQLRRLQNALCHDSYSEEKQAQHLQSTLSAQLSHFRSHYASFAEGAIEISIDNATTELSLDIQLKKYPMKDFAGLASELNSIIKTYDKLNNRNNKKDEKALYKHAMHLIRLLMTGTDILTGKGIITYRQAEHGLLMDIRNGRFTFDEIFKMTDEYQRAFELAARATKLPDEPDMERVNSLLMELYDGVGGKHV